MKTTLVAKGSMPQDSGVQSKKSKVITNHGKIFKQSESMEISNKQFKEKFEICKSNYGSARPNYPKCWTL